METMDDFFSKPNCDRCGQHLYSRIQSWFTDETICMDCSNKEREIRNTLKANGDDKDYEGCGYVPSIGE